MLRRAAATVKRPGVRDGDFPEAARADFLRWLGRWAEAAAAYRQALTLTNNARERTFLAARVATCEAAGDP